MNEKLLEPLELNESIKLQNRLAFAPITRCMADEAHCATDEMVAYYARRAEAGLIISEATLTSKQAQGYPNQPGIFTQEHISAWKRVNDEVHKKGAKSFCQLFHSGRVSHKAFNNLTPVAPSDTSLEGRVPRTKLEYGDARGLSFSEVKELIQEFVQAAKNSIEAGFDGVELHGANGYLLDQFLHQCVNKREDAYGGSVEKRAAFVLEIVDEVAKAIGSERIGIRLSPHAYIYMEHISGDEETFKYLLKELEKRKLAYVHTGVFDDSARVEYLDDTVTEFLKKHYSGAVMGNGSYSVEEANRLVKDNKADFFSFGRAFVANSDLVQKVRDNSALNEYSEALLATLD